MMILIHSSGVLAERPGVFWCDDAPDLRPLGERTATQEQRIERFGNLFSNE